jgi:hypothetical protein
LPATHFEPPSKTQHEVEAHTFASILAQYSSILEGVSLNTLHQVQAVMNKYGVKQYPTVIAVMGGSDLRIDYEAKVKKEHLEKFVMSITSK